MSEIIIILVSGLVAVLVSYIIWEILHSGKYEIVEFKDGRFAVRIRGYLSEYWFTWFYLDDNGYCNTGDETCYCKSLEDASTRMRKLLSKKESSIPVVYKRYKMENK